MASRFGSATQRRLDVTNRRREVEKRAARDARRLEGLPEVRPPYRPHRPYKVSGTDHKTYYALKIQGGFLLALFSITALARAPFYQDQNAFDFDLADQELIAMEDIVQTRHELPPPPPPRPPVPVEVPDDEILEDDVLQLDATLDLDELIAELPPPPPPAEEEVVDDEPEIFVVVEDPPVMIGGMAALMKEGSKEQRALLAAEKAVAVAKALMSLQVAVAKAAELPWPANLPAIANATAIGSQAVAAIKGVQLPVAHTGRDYIPSESPYLLDKGERVVSANQNRDLTRFLQSENQGVTIINNAPGVVHRPGPNPNEIIAEAVSQAVGAVDARIARGGSQTSKNLEQSFGLSRARGARR